jgi:hypothetical protein
VKRIAIPAISAVAVVAILTGLFLSGHYRLATLTPAQLTFKQPKPPSPPEDCSGVARTIVEVTASAEYRHQKKTKSAMSLGTDEIAIYKAVIKQWNARVHSPLMVSSETFPIELTSPTIDLSNCSCLKDIPAESLIGASRSFHKLAPNVLVGENVRLVNPTQQARLVSSNDPSTTIGKRKPVHDAVHEAFSTGLFSMSEIAFDDEHRHALVTYSYHCGLLCGSGATLVFEKVDGEWEKSHRECGGWIS